MLITSDNICWIPQKSLCRKVYPKKKKFAQDSDMLKKNGEKMMVRARRDASYN